jgi:hypothetical protein
MQDQDARVPYKEPTESLDFSQALSRLKNGSKVTREGWRDTCFIEAQYPDANSKMTKPYIFMTKGENKFPCDLSCESIFATDWKIVN